MADVTCVNWRVSRVRLDTTHRFHTLDVPTRGRHDNNVRVVATFHLRRDEQSVGRPGRVQNRLAVECTLACGIVSRNEVDAPAGDGLLPLHHFSSLTFDADYIVFRR